MPTQPIYLKIGPNWQCCLAGSSKTAPRILIFSIVLGAKYLSYLKSIATFALKFFEYIISVLASVDHFPKFRTERWTNCLFLGKSISPDEYRMVFWRTPEARKVDLSTLPLDLYRLQVTFFKEVNIWICNEDWMPQAINGKVDLSRSLHLYGVSYKIKTN